jgi:hypothetical protein
VLESHDESLGKSDGANHRKVGETGIGASLRVQARVCIDVQPVDHEHQAFRAGSVWMSMKR